MPDRVFSLMQRHQQLDEKLRRLQARRSADPQEIAQLKKLKLALRDVLTRMAGPRRNPSSGQLG